MDMKRTIIFGVEQFADQLYRLLKDDADYEVEAFCLDHKYRCSNQHEIKNHLGLPAVDFEDLEKYYSPNEYGILFCIGYTDMNRLRESRMKSAKERGYQILSYCHPTAIVQADAIGTGNIFMEGCIIGQGVTIGDGNIFWPASHIAHHTSVGNYNFFTISVAVAGNIKIHDFCVFGANSTVKNGIEINDGTLIGAGAYISHDTEAWSCYTPPRTYKLEGKSSLDFRL